MKREIKFRAWDHVNELLLDIAGFVYESSTQVRVWYRTDTGFQNESFNAGRLSIQQFTGLLDKNGKEIYEGDLVKIWVSSTIEEWEHVETCEVLFKCGSFCMVNEKRSYSLYNKCNTNPLNKFFECEVIGNVFEHPHLIQKEEVK